MFKKYGLFWGLEWTLWSLMWFNCLNYLGKVDMFLISKQDGYMSEKMLLLRVRPNQHSGIFKLCFNSCSILILNWQFWHQNWAFKVSKQSFMRPKATQKLRVGRIPIIKLRLLVITNWKYVFKLKNLNFLPMADLFPKNGCVFP